MSIDGIAALLFVLILALFLWQKRKQVQLQKALFPILYVIMYRSSFGLKTMDRIAKKFPRTLKALGDISVILGFIGMLLICAQLIYNTIEVIIGKAAPGIQPVLPIEAKGVFFVPFLYWIISIFLLALVHEFSHGVLARAHNMPVKSSGFAFLCLLLPVIPAAFVEPDEKTVQKRPNRQQLGLFAAGPISNILFALAIFGLFFAANPLLTAAFEQQGVQTVTVEGPSKEAGLQQGDIITGINGVKITSAQNITKIIEPLKPGETITTELESKTLNITLGEHPENNTKPYLGIQVKNNLVPKQEFTQKYGTWTPPIIKWSSGLLFWLFMLNIGIGLFNLLPIGPLDGGRMFQLVCLKLFNKTTALKIWGYVSVFFAIIIILNIILGIIL
ncbi:site-2 protease family protein [Candidatus Woesearchaeota archaeon]|nr:site-2 protease family protein [Candidatus Woesearchaeota archaeon]MBW3016240.1 site-2 protease family protein [Candidatus Woesearchaeota archaeon]